MRVGTSDPQGLFSDLARTQSLLPCTRLSQSSACARAVRAALEVPDPNQLPASTSAPPENSWLQKCSNGWLISQILAQEDGEAGQELPAGESILPAAPAGWLWAPGRHLPGPVGTICKKGQYCG